MIVQLQCYCHWPSEKQNRIATLIAERAELILGNSISPLVRDLIFVDNLQPSFQSAVPLFQKSQKGICLAERPANKSQVEISDFLGRQKGNTKSSR